jgi:RNA polymerase sigma-70 factor (ECF subfamily)
VRTRDKLRGHAFEFPPRERLASVMDSVHTVIYLLFNEGFHSTDDSRVMNLELCREATHLVSLLVGEPRVVNRDTLGLLALMRFHLARSASRVDEDGVEIPLDQQVRSRWDTDAIAEASRWLELAQKVAPGASGRFFIEAKIAEQHCSALTFDTTNWTEIVRWYHALVDTTQSPVAALNRAIAVGYAGNLDDAITQIASIRQHELFRQSHLPAAALAHLTAMQGDATSARRHADEADRLGASPREQRALRAQLRRKVALT